MKRLKVFLVLLCVFSSSAALSELYKLVDKDGKIYFTDKKPESDQVDKAVSSVELKNTNVQPSIADNEKSIRKNPSLTAREQAEREERRKAAKEELSASLENDKLRSAAWEWKRKNCYTEYNTGGNGRFHCQHGECGEGVYGSKELCHKKIPAEYKKFLPECMSVYDWNKFVARDKANMEDERKKKLAERGMED
jgi:hypothetical protein